MQTPVAVFRCPSDPNGKQLLTSDIRHFDGVGNRAGARISLSLSNYPAVTGLYDRPGTFQNDGVFFNNSSIRFASVTDGASNTFAVGEHDTRCGAAVWAGSRNPPGGCHWGIYQNRGRVSKKLNSPRSANVPGWDSCNSCSEAFSSSHTGGAFFLMCDGSVQFISENIHYSNAGLSRSNLTRGTAYNSDQLGLYQKLGIRHDGATLGEF